MKHCYYTVFSLGREGDAKTPAHPCQLVRNWAGRQAAVGSFELKGRSGSRMWLDSWDACMYGKQKRWEPFVICIKQRDFFCARALKRGIWWLGLDIGGETRTCGYCLCACMRRVFWGVYLGARAGAYAFDGSCHLCHVMSWVGWLILRERQCWVW